MEMQLKIADKANPDHTKTVDLPLPMLSDVKIPLSSNSIVA